MAETVQAAWAEAIKEGNERWRKDDFAGMLAHYQSIGRFFEDAPPAWKRHYLGNLGIAYQENGQDERAIAAYIKAIQVKGDEDESVIATINGNLANALLSMGRADESLIYLSQPEDYHRNNVPIGPEEKKQWAFKLGNALETKARALYALNDKSCVAVAKEAVDLLYEYWEDAHATGRAIRTLAICWEAKTREGCA